jgi:hypothetical protein
MKSKKLIDQEPPHFVKEFMIGNTRICIADNYCRDKTPEDVQRILKEIGHKAYAAMAAAQDMKAQDQQEKAL